MRRAIRGLTALAGAAAVAVMGSSTGAFAASGGAIALPRSASATAVVTPRAVTGTVHAVGQHVDLNAANLCSQKVAKGHFTCFALRRTDVKAHTGITPQVDPGGYGPSSLQSAYALPSAADGAGRTVFVVDAYNDPNAETDLATYRTQYGLPACTTANGCFSKVNENGSSATATLPVNDTGWAGEISLDLDMVSAICPQCHITLVEASASDDNLFTAVHRAVLMGAKYISMSWGGPEDGTEASYDTQYFNAPGTVFTASSGDDSYSAGVIYPSTSPKVVSVGGTSLTTSTDARGWSESAWAGAGSGCSRDEVKPSFQSSVTACSRRAATDVSADADPETGVAVYQTYGASGWGVYGGTSEAAPIIASVYALAGLPGGSDNPVSYPWAHKSALNDVTTGSNGTCSPSTLCHGATGWDGPTGLGTPNGIAAFTSGSGATPVTVVTPPAQTGTVGVPVTHLQLSASGGTAPYTWSATGLPDGVSISSSGLISGTPTTANAYSVTATATDSTAGTPVVGTATFSWTVSAAGTSCSGQTLANPGFESGPKVWSASPSVIGQYGTSEPAHTGTWDAWLDGYGTAHTDGLSQTVSIPAGCSASFSYYLHVDSAETTADVAYDTLKVSVGGTVLATASNLDKGTGYTQHALDLSSYAGQTVTVSFTGTEDSSLRTSFVIDDAALTLS